ncbi:hypothetical protein I549_0102 [Mycobacterium avium subsp. avium 2285 (R)]|uniref:Uncharacterized protein n=1 Tax=Mycobacterium avium (strain 104) TaxID=243243 RepID=A0A0H2ZZB3_MYCA1|nr:hypothetical protein MAV_0165 [Mycobacterium avium 104]ETZ44100.1 hypothetical protein L837_4222 [Mycobacterium avium MAV_061107_1842]ETZ45496.1 hypothetical protein L838_3953 [Mycobacterium avium MAV_120709_2344]ETZ48865.1 hypothetical protein L839_2978 [Mycobacterium avium MAV_120809_2495]ETZ59296.1 hypothetical protein L841_4703 [Mycobacterium sp. MAC_080597_8934]ETZ72337.1 hypothetical protein L840_1387 [Mycobacterium sp. MAC_011194_8550]EUA41639.1 hypothetical protein I549_0102 [Mycob
MHLTLHLNVLRGRWQRPRRGHTGGCGRTPSALSRWAVRQAEMILLGTSVQL